LRFEGYIIVLHHLYLFVSSIMHSLRPFSFSILTSLLSLSSNTLVFSPSSISASRFCIILLSLFFHSHSVLSLFPISNFSIHFGSFSSVTLFYSILCTGLATVSILWFPYYASGCNYGFHTTVSILQFLYYARNYGFHTTVSILRFPYYGFCTMVSIQRFP
jgi:hypothetical protein